MCNAYCETSGYILCLYIVQWKQWKQFQLDCLQLRIKCIKWWIIDRELSIYYTMYDAAWCCCWYNANAACRSADSWISLSDVTRKKPAGNGPIIACYGDEKYNWNYGSPVVWKNQFWKIRMFDIDFKWVFFNKPQELLHETHNNNAQSLPFCLQCTYRIASNELVINNKTEMKTSDFVRCNELHKIHSIHCV